MADQNGFFCKIAAPDIQAPTRTESDRPPLPSLKLRHKTAKKPSTAISGYNGGVSGK